CGQGVYFADTRYLSALRWTLEGQSPVVLSSHADQNFFSRTDLVNEAFMTAEGQAVRRESLHFNSMRLVDGAVHESLLVTNYNPFPVTVRLALEVRADFRDMFEVRGFADRKAHGTFLLPLETPEALTLRYLGTDQALRETVLHLERAPERLEVLRFRETREVGAIAHYTLQLAPLGTERLDLAIEPRLDGQGFAPNRALELELDHLERLQQQALSAFTGLQSSDEAFDKFLNRGVLDLLSLVSPTPAGNYLVAGLPWYACPFGRDGLLTAYQALMLDPSLAEGTLRYLARFQGSKVDPACDEEPGKILHESREGELSRTGEMPFGPSYCTVDATPLFLVLMSEHYRWTGNLGLVRALWPHALRALEWIDRYGDADGDGFVEYRKQGERGLSNQGWKDSWDSVIHPDGTLAEAPIALAEVQGYVYDAKVRMAELAQVLGEADLAAQLAAEAARLKQAFNTAFWNEEAGHFVIALDGAKRQVVSPTSNPGHGLWSGIIDEAKAPFVAQELLSPRMFSGWGIRTMGTNSPNYNPISYHNGTIWPHDNSLVIKGLVQYGHRDEAATVSAALFDAARHFPNSRLPELFCGFTREGRFSRPVPYPVACSPQAWAAGTPLLVLQSLLGLKPDAAAGILHITRPNLPAWAGEVTVTGLRVGRGTVDLAFCHQEGRTECRVLRSEGELRVIIEP
ncbi:MAG TPA: glycogen debranching N-terminal domain-containing protein, partial [Stenomitos sp.]